MWLFRVRLKNYCKQGFVRLNLLEQGRALLTSSNEETLPIPLHETWPVVTGPSSLGPWTGSQGPWAWDHAPSTYYHCHLCTVGAGCFAGAAVRGPAAGGYGAQSLQLSRRVQDHGPRIMSPVLWRLAL